MKANALGAMPATTPATNTRHTISTGPRCRHCPTDEAACARTYPCCSDCSHKFGEPQPTPTITRRCKDCKRPFTLTVGRGRRTERCGPCRTTNAKTQQLLRFARCDDDAAGTDRGYHRHRYRNERACRACADAHAVAVRVAAHRKGREARSPSRARKFGLVRVTAHLVLPYCNCGWTGSQQETQGAAMRPYRDHDCLTHGGDE